MKCINLARINPDIAVASLSTENDIAAFVFEDCWTGHDIDAEVSIERVQELLKKDCFIRPDSRCDRRINGVINVWYKLLNLVEDGEFSVTADIAFQFASLNADPIFPVKINKSISDLFILLADSLDEIKCVFERAYWVFSCMVSWNIYPGFNQNIARMMMNGVLLSSGYPATSFPIIHRDEFFRTIEIFDETSNITQNHELMRSFFDARVIKYLNYDIYKGRRSSF